MIARTRNSMIANTTASERISNLRSNARRRILRGSRFTPTRYAQPSGDSMACTRSQCCNALTMDSSAGSTAKSNSPVATVNAATHLGRLRRYHSSNEIQLYVPDIPL